MTSVADDSPCGRVAARLPEKASLVWVDPYAKLLDHADEVARLLEGDFSGFDELDDRCRDEEAFDVVRAAAFQAGVAMDELDPDDVNELLSLVHDRDESVSLLEQLAARSRDLSVGLRLDIPAASSSSSVVADVAAMLDVSPGDPAVEAFASSATQVSLMALVRASDLVVLADADPLDLVTLTVTDVGDFVPGWGAGWLDRLQVPGSVMVTVEEFRQVSWLDGVPHRRGSWFDVCGGFTPPQLEVAPLEVSASLKGAAGELFAALVRDGWSTRGAYHAAVAESSLAGADVARVRLTRRAPATSPSMPGLQS